MDEKSIKEALQKGERVLHAPQAGKDVGKHDIQSLYDVLLKRE